MLLMMLGVGRRRWTTRQNILHQASTMNYALLTRPCLRVLLSSADNRGDSRSKEIHSRLGQVLLSTTSAINPPLFLNLFYRMDPIISIRVFFFIIDSSLFRRSGKFNVNKVTEPEVGDQS